MEEYVEKISIEALWNQLIYEMYFSKVKIDKEKIRQKVLNNKKILYNLSEIVFRVKKEEKYNNKLALLSKKSKQMDLKMQHFYIAYQTANLSEVIWDG